MACINLKPKPAKCESIPVTPLPADHTVDPIPLWIAEYTERAKEKWDSHFSDIKTVEDCIVGAHNDASVYDLNSNGKFKRASHQFCISDKAIREAVKELRKQKFTEDYSDFEQIIAEFDFMRNIPGISDITVYDTALRYSYLRFKGQPTYMPAKKVYLHRGAIWGARDLIRISRLKNFSYINKRIDYSENHPFLPADAFCSMFAELDAAHIEDFLCVCHKNMKEYVKDLKIKTK